MIHGSEIYSHRGTTEGEDDADGEVLDDDSGAAGGLPWAGSDRDYYYEEVGLRRLSPVGLL